MRWACSKNRWRLLVIVLSCVAFLDILGVFLRLCEKDYDSEFVYPLEVNFTVLLHDIRSGVTPTVEPLNQYKHVFLSENSDKCQSNEVDADVEKNVILLLVIKSAIGHFELRNAIRNSWGKEDQLSKETIRRIFVVGQSADDTQVQKKIDQEQREFADIVQVAFIDAYSNNTIKSMASISWVFQHCPRAEFILLVDDDFYISVKNLFQFARHPVEPPSEIIGSSPDRYDGRLYGGYVYVVKPMRFKLAKWYIPLHEYPYSKYPPFVMGGAVILSRSALQDLYFSIKYTRTFRFDDVYFGIAAKKAGIKAIHNPNFYKWKRNYNKDTFAKVIASHEYSNPEELMRVWQEQKNMGNA